MVCKSNQELIKKECSRCITKCNPDQVRNPKTGRCVLKKNLTPNKKRTYKKRSPIQKINTPTLLESINSSFITPTPLNFSNPISSRSKSSRGSRSSSKTPTNPRIRTLLLTTTFVFKNKQYKAVHRGMEIKKVIVKNYKQQDETRMEINVYSEICDMNEIELTLKNEDDNELKVIELENQFYFYDSDHILYDTEGTEVGTYLSSTNRGKGGRGLGKNRLDVIEFNTNSNSNSSNNSFSSILNRYTPINL